MVSLPAAVRGTRHECEQVPLNQTQTCRTRFFWRPCRWQTPRLQTVFIRELVGYAADPDEPVIQPQIFSVRLTVTELVSGPPAFKTSVSCRLRKAAAQTATGWNCTKPRCRLFEPDIGLIVAAGRNFYDAGRLIQEHKIWPARQNEVLNIFAGDFQFAQRDGFFCELQREPRAPFCEIWSDPIDSVTINKHLVRE